MQPELDGATYHPVGRTIRLGNSREPTHDWSVAVVTAGTSDRPVAIEAEETLRTFGARPVPIDDVGVAGLHRIVEHRERLNDCQVIIVVAGMEGALPSVVTGLTSKPIVAVPTSVGYGAAFKGLTALFAMLTGCASGATVVNIDNGFGAAAAALRILNLLEPKSDAVGLNVGSANAPGHGDGHPTSDRTERS
jgi:NCAIR mutase (PurE)-related protein